MLGNRDAVVLLWHNVGVPTGLAAAVGTRERPLRLFGGHQRGWSTLGTVGPAVSGCRRWQLAPVMRSWFGGQPPSRNYGQAWARLKRFGERLIATHDRCRLGAGRRTRASSSARTSYSTSDVTRATRDAPTQRVVFAITAAAERIAVGSART